MIETLQGLIQKTLADLSIEYQGEISIERSRRPEHGHFCLLYTSPSPRDGLLSRMPSSA